MRTSSIIEGLTILEKYRDKPDGYNTGAEHDQIFAYAPDIPVSPDDATRLALLGWFQEGMQHGEFSPLEGWACYT